MKIIKTIVLSLLPLMGFSQAKNILQTTNTIDTTWSIYQQNTPTSVYGNRREFARMEQDTFLIFSKLLRTEAFGDNRLSQIRVKYVLTVDSLGNWNQIKVDSIPVNWSNVIGAPSFITTEVDPHYSNDPAFWVTNQRIINWDNAFSWGNHALAGYLTSSLAASTYQPIGSYATANNTMTFSNKTWNGAAITDTYISSASTWNAKQNAITTGSSLQYLKGDLTLGTFPIDTGYNAGWGLTKTGAGNTKTFSVNQDSVMSVAAANSAISSMTNNINGKVPNSRTLTINGVPFDLSADRSWTISAGTGTVTSCGLTSTDLSVTGSPITTSGSITANLTTTGVSAGTYRFVTVDTKGRVTAGWNPTISTPTRTLNTNYTVSATQWATVSYPIRITWNVTAILGATGSATLQYSTNGGTSWESYPPVSNNIGLGLVLSGYNDFQLTGDIPPNALVRIVTAVNDPLRCQVTIRTEQKETIY